MALPRVRRGASVLCRVEFLPCGNLLSEHQPVRLFAWRDRIPMSRYPIWILPNPEPLQAVGRYAEEAVRFKRLSSATSLKSSSPPKALSTVPYLLTVADS